MAADAYGRNTMRRQMYMAALAEQVERDLDRNGSYNLEHLGNPTDPKVQAELDRMAARLVAREKEGDPTLHDMLAIAVSGNAWLKSIIKASQTMPEIEGHKPGSDALVDSLLRHADITDSITPTPVRGDMIPDHLLPRLAFKAAELASVNGILSKELVDAVMDRVDSISPGHPTKRLVTHVSLFLAMVAVSPRDAEDAINMASAFLGRFRSERMMVDIAAAADRAAGQDELQRCWILQLMTAARFRMARTDVMISASPELLTLVEVTDGVIRPGAATVAIPLRGGEDRGGEHGSGGRGRRRPKGPKPTRH